MFERKPKPFSPALIAFAALALLALVAIVLLRKQG